jgi:hypothetical protein
MSNKSKSNDVAVYAQLACLVALFYGPSVINGTKKAAAKTNKIVKTSYKTAKWKIYDKKKMTKEVELLEQMWSNSQ